MRADGISLRPPTPLTTKWIPKTLDAGADRWRLQRSALDGIAQSGGNFGLALKLSAFPTWNGRRD